MPWIVSSITDNGAIAARCGGWSCATNSWLIAGIREADHADLVVRDPRLRGDRLDRVVAVGRLQLLEVVERAAGAAGAAHVDADGRVAERLRDQRARLRRLRIGGRVAGVLDHRRVRALARPGPGSCTVIDERDAVARAQVAVAVADLLRRVERLGRRRGPRRHVERRRSRRASRPSRPRRDSRSRPERCGR